MKKALLLLFTIPLLGVTKIEEKPILIVKKSPERPTIEQMVQLKESELGRINSRIKVRLAEFEN